MPWSCTNVFSTILAYHNIMAYLFDNRLQLRNGDLLGHIIEYTLGISQGFAAISAVVRNVINNFIRSINTRKFMSFMPLLTTRFLATWFAKRFRSSDNLILHAFLAGRRTAVA